MATIDGNPNVPRVTIKAVTDLGYAMAHCRIPVIDQITVENPGPARHGAVLDVEIVDAKLDPASMLAVDETQPSKIRVTLRDSADQEFATTVVDVTILAANQRKANLPQLALEMLAAKRSVAPAWRLCPSAGSTRPCPAAGFGLAQRYTQPADASRSRSSTQRHSVVVEAAGPNTFVRSPAVRSATSRSRPAPACGTTPAPSADTFIRETAALPFA